MRDIPGDVYLPFHEYLPVLAGKPSYAHAMAVGDIVDAENDTLRKSILSQVREAIRKRRFAAIILDQQVFQSEIGKNYRYSGADFHNSSSYIPVKGSKMRPEAVFVRKLE